MPGHAKSSALRTGETRAASHRRRRLGVALVLIGLAGLLAAGGYYFHRRAARKPPVIVQLLPLPQEEERAIFREMARIGRVVLRLTPEQIEGLSATWQRLPQSIDELIEAQRRTNEVLTPMQRAILQPVRRALRNQVIDRHLEPTRNHFTPEDFEKLRAAVRLRVEQRLAEAERNPRRPGPWPPATPSR